MRFVEGNHLIQQFTPATTDPPLGNPILPRTTDGSSYGMEVHGANRAGHFDTKLGIVVEEEKLGGRFIGEGFS